MESSSDEHRSRLAAGDPLALKIEAGRREPERSKLRILADGLFKAASGTLEGPDIEDLLEKAGLIEWVIFDSENPEHTLAYFDFGVEDGDRVWLTTDFADELLKHEDPQKGEEDGRT